MNVVHIDGALDCSTLRMGNLPSYPDTPTVFFKVFEGAQAHPVWAMDRVAVVVYCHVIIAQRRSIIPNQCHIQLSISANLVSATEATYLVAKSLTWHTSPTIMAEAENMIKAMARGKQVINWPSNSKIALPQTGPLSPLKLPQER